MPEGILAPARAATCQQRVEEEPGALRPLVADDRFEGLEPLGRLLRVGVLRQAGGPGGWRTTSGVTSMGVGSWGGGGGPRGRVRLYS